ncbi:MAG: FIST C-terminal domain-containing protein [Firmicutes bacterium]|nr:FIST C-terminal domain-containing protein [Bacillota bacterium]
MLKTKVGYSVEKDSFTSGSTTAQMACEGMEPKVGLLFTSVMQDQTAIINGVKSVTNAPIVGCTSSGGIIVPDGVISSENGFSGMMTFDDPDLKVGVACHAAGDDARAIGRKVALEAVKNAGSNKVPSYFYMVASPKEEESYLKGIQDVIGRVPFFGGSAADDTVEGKWSIFCNDTVFSDGVAVVFFYTNKKFVTEYTGAYHETGKYGIVTAVDANRTIAQIDGVNALDKYMEWTGKTEEDVKGGNLLGASILNPLGMKDPIGNLTVIRHPMSSTDDHKINIGNDAVIGTCAMLMEGTVDGLIESTGNAVKVVNEEMNRKVAGYFLVHCGGRKLGIGDRINEVHEQLVRETNGVPFITIFTFGEYGYHDHSANSCGGLMLSFTGMSEE